MRKTAASLPAEPGSLWPNNSIRWWTFIFLEGHHQGSKKDMGFEPDNCGFRWMSLLLRGFHVSELRSFWQWKVYEKSTLLEFFVVVAVVVKITITASSDKGQRINPCASPSLIACLPNDTIPRKCWSCWLTSHEEHFSQLDEGFCQCQCWVCYRREQLANGFLLVWFRMGSACD